MKIIEYFDSELSQRFLQQFFVSRIDTDLVNRVILDFTHPETLEGEIHPGNTSREFFDEDIKWKSKRIGRTAFDYKGEEIVHPDWSRQANPEQVRYEIESYPYFVSREEVEAAGYEVKKMFVTSI